MNVFWNCVTFALIQYVTNGTLSPKRRKYLNMDQQNMGRWRSWLSHLSNTQKVLSSILGQLIRRLQ